MRLKLSWANRNFRDSLRGDTAAATMQDRLNCLTPITKMVAKEQWDEIIVIQPATTTTETTK